MLMARYAHVDPENMCQPDKPLRYIGQPGIPLAMSVTLTYLLKISAAMLMARYAHVDPENMSQPDTPHEIWASPVLPEHVVWPGIPLKMCTTLVYHGKHP
jgi:hypothetical protein